MGSLIKQLLVFVFCVVIIGLLVMAIRAVLPMLGLPAPIEYVIWILLIVVILIGIGRYFGLLDWKKDGPP